MNDTADRPAPAGRGAGFRGHLETVTRAFVSGWAHDARDPNTPVVLAVQVDGIPVGQVVADGFRQDLLNAGIGDGRCAFRFAFEGGLDPDRRHLVDVREVANGTALHGSPAIQETVPPPAIPRTPTALRWQGYVELANRHRIAGWAFDKESPNTPIALVVVDNGSVVARVLANRYREDLVGASMGDGRHGFTVLFPGGLSPLVRHVIRIVGESDGCDLLREPIVIEAAHDFDEALMQRVRSAVQALADPASEERALAFLAAQSEAVLGMGAGRVSGRETRAARHALERRWGRPAVAAMEDGGAPRRRALVVDDRVPVPGRDAGSVAIVSHLRALQALGFDVSLVASAELALPAAAVAALGELGIECLGLPYYASVEEVLRRQRECFDLVYLHRAGNAARYLALARDYAGPGTRILYSVADLHAQRLERQARIERRPELLGHSARVRLIECTGALLADAVLTHSGEEAAWLREHVPAANVHVVPWEVPVREVAVPVADRRGVVFLGNFLHAPNVDAVRVLATEVMPRVWAEDPSIECLVVGDNAPEPVRRLARPGLRILGHVPELASAFAAARVSIAPLRYGAGVKGKVLESFAAGLPCVMSPIAAEGIALGATLSELVAPDTAAMAALVLRLHRDTAFASAAADAGLALIREHYNANVVIEALGRAVGPVSA